MQQEQLLMGEWLDSLMYEQWGSKALTVQHEGQAYTCATNGHGLTLVAGAGSIAAPTDRARAVANLLQYDLARGRKRRTLSLAALRSWLPADPAEHPCPVCKGGEIKEFRCETCRGEGVTDCHSCGKPSECHTCGGFKKSLQCKECEGDHTVAAAPSLAAIAVGATAPIINRRVLQRFLGPLLRGEDVEVRFGDQTDLVSFHGNGWLVIVMPFSAEPINVDKDGPVGSALFQLSEAAS